MTIYVSGSLAYDRIMDFRGRFSDHILPDKIHILNLCFTVNGMLEKFGGTAGNIAYSLRLLGEDPIILATIGKDYESYFRWFQRNNISVGGIKIIAEEFTAGAYITTDMADNQITGFNPGAMKYRSGYGFEKSDFRSSLVLIAPGNLGDMAEYAAVCRKKGMDFICDPGQSLTAWEGKALREWIEGSRILISNDYEMEMIMNMTGLDRRGLLDLTGAVIITLGEKGSLVATKELEFIIPAVKLTEVVDPTGAGDAYRAGLLKGIVSGKDLISAAKTGAVAASYAVEKYGTQEHHYSFQEFAERYSENFGEF